jgi:hypothetical protein
LLRTGHYSLEATPPVKRKREVFFSWFPWKQDARLTTDTHRPRYPPFPQLRVRIAIATMSCFFLSAYDQLHDEYDLVGETNAPTVG